MTFVDEDISSRGTLMHPDSTNMGERRCRLEHLPCVFVRIQLIWTRLFPTPFQRLSSNVTREIAYYYSFLPNVLARERKDIWAFKILSNTWEHFAMRRTVFGNIITSVFVGQEKVFMVLRDLTSAFEDPPYYGIWDCGSMKKFAFQRDRYACAVAYDQVRDCVFILGGRSFMILDDAEVKRSEQFLVRTERTEQLTDLLESRYGFGLCWHHALLYLCAGSLPSIHTFNPVSLVHTALSYLASDTETDTAYLAVSYKDEVVLLSKTYMWKGQGQQWRRTARAAESVVACIGQPVLVNAWLYYSGSSGCTAFNLETLEIIRHLRSIPE